MLSSDTVENSSIVTLVYDGGIQAHEVDAVRGRMADAAKHGHLRLLVDMHGIDHDRDQPEALWDDLKGAGLLADVERAAVLTDMSALSEVVDATNDLPLMTLQIFAPGDREHAVEWLQS